MSRVTIKDIAKELSISPSTVSRALRNHPDISKETKKSVQDMAQKLDYFPDSLAQALKSKRSNSIGIIVPEIKHHYFSSAISGIEEVTYNSDFSIMVCQSNEDYKREEVNLKALLSKRIAGLLISVSQTTTDVSHFDILTKRGIPAVFFDRITEGISHSRVIADDYDGAYKAVSHLIERGYKRIAHIAGPENISIGHNRLEGYKNALIDNGYHYNEQYVIRGGFRQQDGADAILSILRMNPRPDAVFAVNDPVAIGAFTVLKDKNISIPSEMALVGFSNNPVSALIEPSLTTVSQPSYEIGKTAATLLLKQIKSRSKSFRKVEKILKTQLIVRKST